MQTTKFNLILLSKSFYDDFPQHKYPEILTKKNRPYILLLLKIDKLDFGIPFRSNITHKYAYITDKRLKSGLDYTKAIPIIKINYIDKKVPFIKNYEKKILLANEHKMLKKFKKFLKNYRSSIQAQSKRLPLSVKFSSLQYFHKELNIESSNKTQISAYTQVESEKTEVKKNIEIKTETQKEIKTQTKKEVDKGPTLE